MLEGVPVPPDLLDVDWIARRGAAQLATKSDFGVPVSFAFSDRGPESGINFLHRVVDDAGRTLKASHYDHGNGVAAADVDGDGRLDVYFTNQAGPNGLWRNVGDGRFEDITERAGVGLADRISVGASFADIDNDGDPDLFVTSVRGGNVLLENDGEGRFDDITDRSGVRYVGHSSGAVFFDYDRDGLLDLFVANVGDYTLDETAPAGASTYYRARVDAFDSHRYPERVEISRLYRNLGQNRFEDVTERTDLVDSGWSGAATPLDVNGDGWPDLYVTNMQGSDEYWENVDGQRFVARGAERFPATPWGAMGIKAFDWNNDGLLDVLVTDMHSDMWEVTEVERFLEERQERLKPDPGHVPPDSILLTSRPDIFGNALFQQGPDGVFTEVADVVWAETYWPWGISVADLNSDGWEDVFVTQSMNFPFRYQVNAVLLNDRGNRFRRAEFLLGIEPRRDGRVAVPWFVLECADRDRGHPACGQPGSAERIPFLGAVGGRSSVIFDVDADGDLDIITNEFNWSPQLLVSDLAQSHPGLRYIQVQLVGTASNRAGLGAEVTVIAGERRFVHVNDGQSGYLSQSSMPLYFGLGDADELDRIEVRWPSGVRQVLDGPVVPNRTLTIREGAG